MFITPRIIVITGASDGIGAALARAYAAPGITLGLMGRDEGKLSAVADSCRASGANVTTASIDVTDEPRMREWLQNFDNSNPVDLVIANAGISAGTGGLTESETQTRHIFSVNLGGVMNSVLPLIGPMQQRGRGQIALMSSLAGIRGLPGCPSYSASKMAVRGLGEAWRGALKKNGIQVSVICPGYIRTNMTRANDFPMPFLMDAEKAAQIIRNGLAANRGTIAFPKAMFWPLWWIASLPGLLVDPFFAALPSKSAK